MRYPNIVSAMTNGVGWAWRQRGERRGGTTASRDFSVFCAPDARRNRHRFCWRCVCCPARGLLRLPLFFLQVTIVVSGAVPDGAVLERKHVRLTRACR
jgi:hypothetical protein